MSRVLFPFGFGGLTFSPVAPTEGSLAPLDQSDFTWSGSTTGPGQLLSSDTFDVIDPRLFQLTAPDGTVYVIRQDIGMESYTPPTGAQVNCP